MDLLELLQTITREAYDASQPTDLQIGTVVKAPPDDELEIRVSEAMAPLKSAVLYLAEPVIEKKLPAAEAPAQISPHPCRCAWPDSTSDSERVHRILHPFRGFFRRCAI